MDKNLFFTTLAINKFLPIFKDYPETNYIICQSLNNLVSREIVKVYSFVIMRDHLHLVWKTEEGEIDEIITSFKKYTGKLIKEYLEIVDRDYLSNLQTDRVDRKFKIWKQTKGNIYIHSLEMLITKVKYIHNNPLKGEYKTVEDCIDYSFSSARAYSVQHSNFQFLEILESIVPWN